MFSLTNWISGIVERAVLQGLARAFRRVLGEQEMQPLLEAAGESDETPVITEKVNGAPKRVKV